MGFLSGLFGGGGGGETEGPPPIEIPEFQRYEGFDPMVSYLSQYSTGLLEGNIPDYYAPMGEYGGDEFENLMRSVSRDIGVSTREDMAKRGVGRGGPTAVAKATADASTKMRFADYERAMAGRESLLKTGVSQAGQVPNYMLGLMGIENQHALGKAQLEIGQRTADASAAERSSSAQSGLWGDIMQGAMSLGTQWLGKAKTGDPEIPETSSYGSPVIT